MAFDRIRLRLRERAAPAVLIAMLVVVAIGAAISLLGSSPSSTLVTANPSPSGFGVIYVHVTGAVNSPGLVTVSIGARVVDALAAAGGCTNEADQAAINLARQLRDGEQIVVPKIGEVPAASGSAGGLINLNTADQAALESLPHVGPALAARIIAYRTEHGGFGSVDELSQVAGIGEKTLADLVTLVTI